MYITANARARSRTNGTVQHSYVPTKVVNDDTSMCLRQATSDLEQGPTHQTAFPSDEVNKCPMNDSGETPKGADVFQSENQAMYQVEDE